ncbi:alpha/beta fold family hydrolase [Stutzerimonas stutzeri CCUG 29243]|uniref:Alpha/beta fold family hydrolase n=1 Tax=Stutzerimonas stutzeri CCUG 29243 TaxID=1196835 RepID=I4CW31_STUST|nr:alpha/beta fold family hydrolase [Stutzerimonas stutzeri CCUG 29243]
MSALALAAGLTLSLPLLAESRTAYGPQLEGFSYPHPLKHYRFESQGKALEMAFMDVEPQGKANGRTALLLHGKNFCGATWERTIEVLSQAGYRVIAPDQVGFCSSSKPEGYQFSFAQLAHNTQALLEQESIEQVTVIGHSMGGMLAARLALNYPQRVEQLVLVNPIGLEDWQAEGVPYASIDQLYQSELKTDFDSIKAYQQKFYYNGSWKAEYDRWVGMLAAARVCASAATSIRWVCSAGDSDTMVPTANTAGKIVHTECAASGNTSSTSALHSSSQATALKRSRSNSQPPTRLPTMPPRPNAARANGIQPALTPVTFSNVGAM